MHGERALQQAVDLASSPGLAPLLRRQSLPDDVLTVIRIAARSAETLDRVARSTGHDQEFLAEAAALYLEQVLFFQTADSYRTLGVTSTASHETISQNMRWLMRWLHPDHDQHEWESTFAKRVSAAWEDLKSPDRRSNYDRWRGANSSPKRRSRRNRMPWIARPRGPTSTRSSLPRIVAAALAGVLVAAAIFFLPGGPRVADSEVTPTTFSPDSLAASPKPAKVPD